MGRTGERLTQSPGPAWKMALAGRCPSPVLVAAGRLRLKGLSFLPTPSPRPAWGWGHTAGVESSLQPPQRMCNEAWPPPPRPSLSLLAGGHRHLP